MRRSSSTDLQSRRIAKNRKWSNWISAAVDITRRYRFRDVVNKYERYILLLYGDGERGYYLLRNMFTSALKTKKKKCYSFFYTSTYCRVYEGGPKSNGNID